MVLQTVSHTRAEACPPPCVNTTNELPPFGHRRGIKPGISIFSKPTSAPLIACLPQDWGTSKPECSKKTRVPSPSGYSVLSTASARKRCQDTFLGKCTDAFSAPQSTFRIRTIVPTVQFDVGARNRTMFLAVNAPFAAVPEHAGFLVEIPAPFVPAIALAGRTTIVLPENSVQFPQGCGDVKSLDFNTDSHENASSTADAGPRDRVYRS